MEKLKFDQIAHLAPINNLEEEKARAIFNSIKNEGWKSDLGPILIYQGALLTGTHRLAALKFLFQSEPDHPVFREEIAWDVTEEIHRNIDAMPEDDLLEKTYEIDDFSSGLGELLAGTPVEQLREHIKEW